MYGIHDNTVYVHFDITNALNWKIMHIFTINEYCVAEHYVASQINPLFTQRDCELAATIK